MVLEQTLNALLLGAMYALVAVGFTLFFGVLDLVNFAHGEMAMLAAFTALSLFGLALGRTTDVPTGPLWAVSAVAILAVGGIGVLTERVALRRLRAAPALLMLLATVGVSSGRPCGSCTPRAPTRRSSPPCSRRGQSTWGRSAYPTIPLRSSELDGS
jgi:branched-subunit amino acid ABC-type transport system permease component